MTLNDYLDQLPEAAQQEIARLQMLTTAMSRELAQQRQRIEALEERLRLYERVMNDDNGA